MDFILILAVCSVGCAVLAACAIVLLTHSCFLFVVNYRLFLDPIRPQTIDLISIMFCLQFFFGQLALVATMYPTFKRLQYARLTMSIWFNILAGAHGVALGFGIVFTRFAQAMCGIDMTEMPPDEVALQLRVFEVPTAMFLLFGVVVLQCGREYTPYHEWETPPNPTNRTWLTITSLTTLTLFGSAATLHNPWFSIFPVFAIIYFAYFIVNRCRRNRVCENRKQTLMSVAATLFSRSEIVQLGDRTAQDDLRTQLVPASDTEQDDGDESASPVQSPESKRSTLTLSPIVSAHSQELELMRSETERESKGETKSELSVSS